jgi:hypothetical protein
MTDGLELGRISISALEEGKVSDEGNVSEEGDLTKYQEDTYIPHMVSN